MDSILPKPTAQNGLRAAQEHVDKQQKEYHLIGRQRKVSGHTLFEFNRKTKEIRPADISREVIVGMDGTPIYKTKTDIHQKPLFRKYGRKTFEVFPQSLQKS